MTQNLPEKSEKEMVYAMENGDEIRLTADMVRQFLVQGESAYVTASELMYFMHECKARRLNPFLRQCWLIKYSRTDPAQIVEAIHHKRSKARKAPDCNGWEKGLILLDKKGEIKKSKGLVLDGETVLGAYFIAKPGSWEIPYELEINLSGYIKKKKGGEVTSFWSKENQPSQIMKVVESQGLSALWGDTVGNTSIPEELPAPIDFTLDKNGMYETEPHELDTSEFDKLAAIQQIDKPSDPAFDKYLSEMAAAQEPKMSVDQFKIESTAQFEELWAHFENWRKAKPPAAGKSETGGTEDHKCKACGYPAKSAKGLKRHTTQQHPPDPPADAGPVTPDPFVGLKNARESLGEDAYAVACESVFGEPERYPETPEEAKSVAVYMNQIAKSGTEV